MSAWAVKFVALFLLVQGAIGRASVGKLQEGCEITEFSEVQVAVEICDVLILENIFVPAGKTLNLNLRDQATLYFRGTITFGYAEWEGPLVAINASNAVIEGEDGSNILVEDFICYGGHGLSISAGHDGENVELNTVYNVTFSDSVVTEGKNAIHVKTHVDGGDGRIEKVVYRNIQFQGASEYGINIQENYRNLPPNSTMPDQARNNIPITELQLINVVGSVDSSAVPIYIFCAEEVFITAYVDISSSIKTNFTQQVRLFEAKMRFWCLTVLSFLFLSQLTTSQPSVGKLQEGCEITEFSEVQVAVEICDILIIDSVFVPAGKTLNMNLRDQATLYFRGTITFGYAEWEGPLVAINASNAVIEGEDGAVFNGQGELYWDGLGEWGSLKPKFFIMQLHNTVMSNMYILNSPQHNVILADSTNVKLVGWVADASAGAENTDVKAGHNTDGFVIMNSTNILLQNSVVYNQDDCVVVYSGSNILVEDFICYGGHGLSISAGHDDENVELNTVYNVTFSDSVVTEGKNAIHVKTHVDGGNGRIEKIVYKNIQIDGPSEYGINIQENYRNLPPNSTMPDEARNNIPITDLKLINVFGSVDSWAVPIYIFCAEGGCFDWEFTEVAVNGTEANMCTYEPTGFFC
ncbi:hypothetical protein YQE_05118, partial [Dendroctonus ponderosae]